MIPETIAALKTTDIDEGFSYFPDSSRREQWGSVPSSVAEHLVAKGESLTARVWESLPATLYLDYTRNGNRSRFQDAFYAKRRDLMILTVAECLDGTGRFIEPVIDGIWSICEETTWCVPAHNNGYRDGIARQLASIDEPIIDLFAAQTAAMMATVLSLVGPVIRRNVPEVANRMSREVYRRILEPFYNRDDFWWMGFSGRSVNNWNPWIISNVLLCILAVETDADMKKAGMIKAVRCLETFLKEYDDDGGCDEGSSYWGRAGGSLFDCADILFEATEGAVNWFADSKVAEMGRFITYAHINGDYYVNFADGPGTLKHHSPQLIYRYGKRIGDKRMQALAMAQYREHGMGPVDQSAIRSIPALFLHEEFEQNELPYEPVKSTWLPGIQFMTKRIVSSDNVEIFFAAKGGSNAESHNHNDVGNFIIYLYGKPAIIDAGVGTYTAKTFSDQRYDIWYMRSDYHNIPTINDFCQIHGEQAGTSGGSGSAAEKAEVQYSQSNGNTSLTADLTKFYTEESGLHRFVRHIDIDENSSQICVSDNYQFNVDQNTVQMHIMSLKRPIARSTYVLSIPVAEGMSLKCRLSDTYEGSAVEEISLDDERLVGVWGESVFRTTLTATAPARNVELSVTFSPDL